jgi:MFS family permease
VALGPDFRRLWSAYAVSELGTALSMGALPLIATLVLHSPVLQVSLLSALSVLAGAALAVPLGPWIEFRRKRPVMVAADLVRFGALAGVPVTAAAGLLSYAQLCLVAVVQAAGGIVFTAASGAHLKALVGPAGRSAANGRFEATFWTANSVGPAVGGALISWLGPTTTLALDAVSFLLSALRIRGLRTPEPAPPVRHPQRRPGDIAAGWRYILGHHELRSLYGNALLFGAGVMAGAPLLAVRMLRELHFPPWQYGLALGVPCLGGVAGAALARPLTRRYGPRAVLLGSGVSRTLWLGALPLAPAGVPGLVVVIAAQTLLLISAGTFNPTFATLRMAATEDGYLSRVIAAWSISSRTAQPIGIALGGLLAASLGTRTAMGVLAVAVAGSAALLPWRVTDRPRVAQPVP